jgi:hypothetical protein
MAEPRMPSLSDFAEAEHCVLEDHTVELTGIQPMFAEEERAPREVIDKITIRDKLRGRQTTIRFYAESWAEIEVQRRGRRPTFHRIDLRYLDAVPATRRYYPIRLLKASGIAAGVTALFAIPAWFGWLSAFTVPATVTGILATAGALFVAWYLSHEKIVFRTLHGRAGVIRFGAGLGTIRQFHKLIPKFVDAIADAAETMLDETAVYLRAEMREHYRLRSDGIITEDECAASTGRILSQFDGPL